MTGELRVIPVRGIPELEEGDDLAELARRRRAGIRGRRRPRRRTEGGVEGRGPGDRPRGFEASDRARELAVDTDPRRLEVILRESREIVRIRPPLVIAETRHGFVCASAGVDASNAKGPDTLVLLPLDPDASARTSARTCPRAHRRRRRRGRLRLVRAGMAHGDDGRRARRRRCHGRRRSRRTEGRSRLRAARDADRRRRRDRRRGAARDGEARRHPGRDRPRTAARAETAAGATWSCRASATCSASAARLGPCGSTRSGAPRPRPSTRSGCAPSASSSRPTSSSTSTTSPTPTSSSTCSTRTIRRRSGVPRAARIQPRSTSWTKRPTTH